MDVEIYLNGKAVARVPIGTIPEYWTAHDIHNEAFRCALEDGLVTQEDFNKCDFGIMPEITR